jgi:hypothetical protein
MVLPEKPANAAELSEEDLERIAGGTPGAKEIIKAGQVAMRASNAASASASLGVLAATAIAASGIVAVEKTMGW